MAAEMAFSENCEKSDKRKESIYKMSSFDNELSMELSSPSPELHENRRMIRKKDLVTLLFLCLCFSHVRPAYPCGEDPLRKLYNYAKATGQIPENVLANIRVQDPPRYWSLLQSHKQYDECVVRVETGSFKRSPANPLVNTRHMKGLLKHQFLSLSSHLKSGSLKRRPFYFLPEVSRRSWNFQERVQDVKAPKMIPFPVNYFPWRIPVMRNSKTKLSLTDPSQFFNLHK